MTDRKTASTITDRELDELYNDLAALREVARSYCPHCGRGDATPPPSTPTNSSAPEPTTPSGSAPTTAGRTRAHTWGGPPASG